MEGIAFTTLMDRLQRGEKLGIDGSVIVTHSSLGPRDIAEGRAFPLTRDKDLTVGRDKDADVVVEIPEVSRRHVALGMREGPSRRLLITDLGTRNGTNVNGRAIPRGKLVAVLEPVVTVSMGDRASVSVMDAKNLKDYLWMLIRARRMA